MTVTIICSKYLGKPELGKRNVSSFLGKTHCFFFDEGPSHHSLKTFCATPMKMIKMSSFFLPIFTINGALVE
jgi:hypothetical protein